MISCIKKSNANFEDKTKIYSCLIRFKPIKSTGLTYSGTDVVTKRKEVQSPKSPLHFSSKIKAFYYKFEVSSLDLERI